MGGTKQKCHKCKSIPCSCPIKIEHTINIKQPGIVLEEIVQLFSYAQLHDSTSILTPGEHTLLTLDVTTTELGQRVKLDSMAVVQYYTNTTGTSFTLHGHYFLYRDNILISFLDIDKVEPKPDNFSQVGDLYPNLTWVDVPPTVGTHRYELRIELSYGNVQILDVLTRSLNAIVFRQAL